MQASIPPPPLIEDAAPEIPTWYRRLIRARLALAIVYVIGVGALAVLAKGVFLEDWSWDTLPWQVLRIAVAAAGLLAMQALLLVGAPKLRKPTPGRRWRPPRGRHIWISLTAGALMAGLLTFGFFATLCSLCGSTIRFLDVLGPGVVPAVIVVGVPWAFWLVVFARRYRRRWDTGFGRMYRLLLAGTWLELIVTIPVDVFVRRRTRCYCDEGTFFALVIGVAMAFWTFGPGLVFLYVDRYRLRRPGTCRECGYDLRGLDAPRCPECGAAFDRRRVSSSPAPSE